MQVYIKLAIEEAEKAFAENEVPVGAVVVDYEKNEVIALAHNRMAQDQNPTHHAEMNAIAAACEKMGNERLTQCDIYVSLEPCPMCASAIAFARFRKVTFGAYDPKSGGVEHGPRIFDHDSCHHTPEVIGGVEEAACADVMRRFFADKR